MLVSTPGIPVTALTEDGGVSMSSAEKESGGFNVLDLPPEILHKALILADPADVVQFAASCRTAHFFFASSPALHRELFLALFNSPSDDSATTFDYLEALQSRIAARGYFRSLSEGVLLPDHRLQISDEKFGDIMKALVRIARERPSSSAASTSALPSRNEDFLQSLLATASLSEYDEYMINHSNRRLTREGARISIITAARQSLCQLRTLCTPSNNSLASEKYRTLAREIVYSRENINKRTNWGPFIPGSGGKVDWVKLEALSVVMGCNLREALEFGDWTGVSLPEGLNNTRSYDNHIGSESNDRDWAGVEEEYQGTYSFLDFRVWEHFNFHGGSSGARPDLIGESEAVGDRMVLKLKLLPAGELPVIPSAVPRTRAQTLAAAFNRDEEDEEDDDDDDFAPGEEIEASSASEGEEEEAGMELQMDSPPTDNINESEEVPEDNIPSVFETSTPTLSFIGTSEPLAFAGTFTSSTHPSVMAERSIRGTVSRTPEGEVFWSYIIRYGGEDKWKMHGIQVGGARSRFGILGTWSTAEGDEMGPHGPFWYWPTAQI